MACKVTCFLSASSSSCIPQAGTDRALGLCFWERCRPCSCGFTQASIVRFNISRWVEPADIMESTWMMRDSAALVSYAKVFLDDLLLPWNVPAAIVLEPDTLVTGDIGRLWNSSVVTKRHTAQAGRVEEQKQAENSQVWVQGDEVTEVQDLPEQPSVHGNLLAAVKDCNVPQSKVRSRPADLCSAGATRLSATAGLHGIAE